MTIIDTHMHLNLDCNNDYYKNKKIDDYNKIIKNTNIDFFIPSINPKVKIFTCEHDCSNNCSILKNSKEKVCPIDCKERDRHRVKIVDGLQNNLIAYCTKCKKIIYEGMDPLREYNIQLIEICKQNNNCLPNLLLTMSNSTINEEIKFYEQNFPNLFLGYKIHQTTNMRGINELIINSTRPILIHSDMHKYDSINNALEFSKKYKGNIVLAHSYLLTNNKIISNLDNLYFDICPTDNFQKNKNNIEHNDNYNYYDNMFEAATKYLPNDKILFGTDWPYGNVKENIKEIEKSKINNKVKKKILSLNAKKAYNI